MRTLRIGTRDSALAIVQAKLVMESIINHDPALNVQLVPMKTTGDRQLEQPLQEIGGKGVFVKELEHALREGIVDLCVHSLKDMAVDLDPGLPLVAVSNRADPRDVLVLPKGAQTLDPSKKIGSSSGRRALQLPRVYPDCVVEPVRGNIITRIEKLDRGDYGALVLAAAGLLRLGLQDRVSRYFSVEEMLPACGQGILGVQARAGEAHDFLGGFHDLNTWYAAVAERAFIRTLGGDCTVPVGVYAVVEQETIIIHGYALDINGRPVPGSIRGKRGLAASLGKELALELRLEAEG